MIWKVVFFADELATNPYRYGVVRANSESEASKLRADVMGDAVRAELAIFVVRDENVYPKNSLKEY